MFFLSSLVLFCLSSLASDVVELEPVRASSTDVFKCSTYDNLVNNCTESPYCLYFNAKCVDDPCLKYLASSGDTCSAMSIDIGAATFNVPCAAINVDTAYVTGADCSGNDGTGQLCGSTLSASPNFPKSYDYCQYAFLRDNKACPVSLCRQANPSNSATVQNQCIKTNKGSCGILSTKDECGLVPKCYWPSDSQGCVIDPCFVKGADCASYAGNGYNTLPAGDKCKEFKPLAPDGEVQLYCVHEKNANPNICYLAYFNKSIRPDDHITYTGTTKNADGTYPTLEWWDVGVNPYYYHPTCTGTLTGCEGAGNCSTIINKKGAFAGAYCTDGTHGGTSMLRIPSLLVFLFVLISMFS